MILLLSCVAAVLTPLVSSVAIGGTRHRRQDDGNFNDDSLPQLPPLDSLPPLDNLPPLDSLPPPQPPTKRPFSFSSDKEANVDVANLDTLAKLVSSIPEFSTLATALNKAGMMDSLSGSGGPYTLFAPTNEAFEKLPQETLARLMGNTRQLKEVLGRHLIKDNIEEKHFQHGYNQLSPVGGDELAVILSGGGGGELRSGYAQASILQFDILASNGVMHVIDTVV